MPDGLDAYHRWLGIPPSEQPPNAYRLLGLRPLECDPEVIQNAADRQTLHLRTYQLGKDSDLSERLLNEVAAASLTLLNPAKKAEYDRRLSAELHPPRPKPAAAPLSSGQPAMLGVPRLATPAPLSPLPRRRRRRLPHRLLPAVAAILLFGAAIVLLGHAVASFFSGGAPSPFPPDRAEPHAITPVEPAPETIVSPLPPPKTEPKKTEPPIVIDSTVHRPRPPLPGPSSPPTPPRDQSNPRRGHE